MESSRKTLKAQNNGGVYIKADSGALRCITASMQIQFVGAIHKYLLKKAVRPNPCGNSRSVIELGYNYPREIILTYSQRVKRGVHNSSRGRGCWLHCVVEI